jgi:peptidoglycan/LPS O-acetylase OafA/YrhL
VDDRAVVASSLFVSNFGRYYNAWLVGHTWSLSIEEQFYLCWPLLLVFLPRKYYFLIIGAIAYSVFYYYMRYYHPLFMLRFFLLLAPALLSGSLLAIALYKDWLKKAHHILMHPVFAFSLVFAILIYLPRTFEFASFFYIPFDYILSSIFITIFTYYAIHCDPKKLLYKVLNFSAIVYIGILSYSIYLWQELFFASSDNFYIHPYWTAFPLNIILLFMMAFISYNLVERPFLTLKRHFQ